MANFIFNWAASELQDGVLNLSVGDYYAHLVTSTPVTNSLTVTNLVLPVISLYASVPLTGLSLNSSRWTFNGFGFPLSVFASTPVGVVICRRNGATPATTDNVICYSDFNNALGQAIILKAGVYSINLQFGVDGAINFLYRYQYNSGTFTSSETVPKGLIFLIGSRNNTVAFTNPRPSKILINTTSDVDLTDRVLSSSVAIGQHSVGVDFQQSLIRPGKVGININSTGFAMPITIYGSNNLPNGFATDWNNLSFFTSIGTFTRQSDEPAPFSLIPCSGNTFWRYLFMTVGGQPRVNEIEFYESALLSPTLNIV